jgi:hypothetical protein
LITEAVPGFVEDIIIITKMNRSDNPVGNRTEYLADYKRTAIPLHRPTGSFQAAYVYV